MNALRFWHTAILLCLTVTLLATAGCGVIRRSPDTRFYVLTLPESSSLPLSRPHVKGPQVGIGPITLPGYLDRTQIFVRNSNSPDIHLAEYDRWGEPLAEGVTRILVENMSTRLVDIDGMAVALRANIPLDWRISIDIARFDGAPGKDVVLDVAWSLTTSHGNPVREGVFVQRVPSGPGMDDLVRAHGELLMHLGETLHQAVRAAEKAKK